MNTKEQYKEDFLQKLNSFASVLSRYVSQDDEWTVKGFIDIFENIYVISSDTKIVSKILELHLFPHFLKFAQENDYIIELATHQNWYPDITFLSKNDSSIKFAVDLKTTYLDEDYPGFCNGFTLGSHGEYFINRESTKNIQYPYNQYCGHFCLGIIYSRAILDKEYETRTFSVSEIKGIPSVIKNFIFFATEKWKIASDKSGSGNTANIGSIQKIDDILSGNGVFAKAGEKIFDDYWSNFGRIQIEKDGIRKPLASLCEYLHYRGLPAELNNPRPPKRREKSE